MRAQASSPGQPRRRRAAVVALAALGGCVEVTPPTDDGVVQDTDVPAGATCADGLAPHGLRRLTRFQYDRVATDLLGEPVAVAASFPPESGSWEGLADAQAVGPGHVAAWWDAAGTLADRVARHRVTTIEVEDAGLDVGEPTTIPGQPGGWWTVTTSGTTPVELLEVALPSAGRWRLTTRGVWLLGFAQQLPAPRLTWRVGGDDVDGGLVDGVLDAPVERAAVVTVDGPTTALLRAAVSGVPADVAGAFALDRIEVDGPLDHPERDQTAAWVRWHPCTPDAADVDGCARDVVAAFAAAAWRRTPATDELDALVGLVDLALEEGDDVDVGLGLALRAVLFAPSFLYRAEDVSTLAPGAARPLAPDELATRLALLLWGSLPDDALAACAAAGALTADPTSDDPCGLPAQVARMLASPRSDALERDFGRQWLGLDAAAGFRHDPVRYPEMDAALAASMVDGVLGTLAEARRAGLDLVDLVDAPWTWGDARLAALYGVPAPAGGAGRLAYADARGGLLGAAFVLAATSHPDRPSPVLRGKWVLDRLTCSPPGAPPAGIPALPAGATSGDVRAFLDAHSQDPVCAHCHDAIDPMGFPSEGFDALGRARATYEDGTPIDVRSTLADGTSVDGLADLAAVLAADPGTRSCLVRQAATWAWERFPTAADAATLADVEAQATASGFTLDALVAALVASEPVRCVAAPVEAP